MQEFYSSAFSRTFALRLFHPWISRRSINLVRKFTDMGERKLSLPWVLSFVSILVLTNTRYSNRDESRGKNCGRRCSLVPLLYAAATAPFNYDRERVSRGELHRRGVRRSRTKLFGGGKNCHCLIATSFAPDSHVITRTITPTRK